MKISKEQVNNVAKLARIKLTEQEQEKFAREMVMIIDLADKLQGVDTADVIPTTHAIKLSNVFREDVCTPWTDRDKVLSNSAENDGACFIVPQVVE